jgi:hypothetical protein
MFKILYVGSFGFVGYYALAKCESSSGNCLFVSTYYFLSYYVLIRYKLLFTYINILFLSIKYFTMFNIILQLLKGNCDE